MTMSTFEQLKKKCEKIELAGVSFLTETGAFAKKASQVDHAEFTFIDGKTMLVPKEVVYSKEFDSLSFKLRPSKNDS